MDEAVVVATARTPIGRAGRGAFNNTAGVDLVHPLIREVLRRGNTAADEIEEIVMGCGYPEGATGGNIARASALRAGLSVCTAGTVVSRFCASGLESIAAAAWRIGFDKVPVAIAGGVESISLVSSTANRNRLRNKWLEDHKPELYHSMVETADIVAERYSIGRDQQDEFALESQRRTFAAQQAGKFADEIVAIDAEKLVADQKTGTAHHERVRVALDEGNRPDTTAEGLAKLKPVREGHFVTAGNASQLSDGASVNLLMRAREARRRNVEPIGIFRGFASAGCEPDEMGIGPVFAVPRLLRRHGLSINDIDLWELNEAFASQAVYCITRLGLDTSKVNVNGGAISIGHPYGMSGSRMVGHALLEGRRRKAKYAVVTMCVAGGMGCAGLLEICGT
ncbi:acetyl-CoA C-acyltransferase [Mesorhizobium abyssinicae]|uniref:acetyl-CoA C-acyltransferase n=1 Tax=Mesorhizobium abyssinicae TaxID=1209958 RepID=UPI003395B0B7